ncbi:hypothetical protein NQK81_13265 [Amycolatopsis roodepoortensis]|uniref:hypothetical protein n=1 Tax=Amycolatopsis roodepoortensis TaxID=700274 RepID=UPI00214AE804|nr:hypothetical protein [Amycolatopsis roodepoortensis]UUV34374.1 hypothetical protein NQK81_13265 [Amycolatopsis roodepoortensis]
MPFLAGQDLTAEALNNITPGIEQGEWTIAANKPIGTPTLIDNWTPFPGAQIAGITHSAGVFTVTRGGIYDISLGVRFSGTASGGHYCFITGVPTEIWIKSSETGVVNVSCSISGKRIPAGGTIRGYAYSAPGTDAIHEQGADLVTGITIYRKGP